MTGFELVAQLIDTLIWPLVVVGVLIVGREHVRSFSRALQARVRDLTSARIGGQEFNFGERAADAVEEVRDLSPQLEPARTEDADRVDPRDSVRPYAGVGSEAIDGLLQIDPRAAVFIGWIDVELKLRDLFASTSSDPRRRNVPVIRMAHQLARDGVLDEPVASLVQDLVSMRNGVVHGADVTSDAARDFVDAADAVAHWIELAQARRLSSSSNSENAA
ncbi:hypothetical protein [Rhodococcus ruber]|uniref:hypothetical protein n=1 Tax=Rhodococcus ruber TaxID=1830 RepID=UPI00034C02C7|nr:hypothetical protein [Rhodococcus ruber]